MSHDHVQNGAGAPNQPGAVRMAVIAGFSHNILIGTIIGSFSVLLASVQLRLGVEVDAASVAMPLVLLSGALIGPVAGVLMGRHSLRMVMIGGGIMAVGGFLLLAFTNSYFLYLVAYGLLLGPAMTLTGSIGPATLVTRWFHRNRGLAIGLVHLSLVVAIMPVALNWLLERQGYIMAYLLLAALVGLILVPMLLFITDHPPRGEVQAPEPAKNRTADGSFSIGQLLAIPRFWAICLAALASMTSSVLLGTLMVPMGVSWGFTRGEAALIMSIMSMAGIAGSVLFGWIADKIGGARALALIAFDCAILWSLLLLSMPFYATAVVAALIGLHGAGAVPGISRALADTLGQASFSRGFGLNSMIGLPFMIIAIVGSAHVYKMAGSYSPAIIGIVIFFIIAIGLGLYAASGRKVEGPQAG